MLRLKSKLRTARSVRPDGKEHSFFPRRIGHSEPTYPVAFHFDQGDAVVVLGFDNEGSRRLSGAIVSAPGTGTVTDGRCQE